jgi:SET domain-containing protein
MSYNPLPDIVTIKDSSLHGLGLFAVTDVPQGTEIGITHVSDNRFEDGWIRTPIGGFYNHSDNPNCETYIQNDLVMIRTIRDIRGGEELTSKYWMYKLGETDA